MKPIDNQKNSLPSNVLSHFPNSHIIALALLSVSLLGFTLLPSIDANANRVTESIAIPKDIYSVSEQIFEEQLEEITYYRTHTETVKAGDNLSLIFKRAGLTDRDMFELLNSNNDSKKLASLYPGHKIEFGVNEDNTLANLVYVKDRLNHLVFDRTEDGFSFEEVNRKADVVLETATAKITTSLYEAGIGANLDDKLIMQMAEIFGWDVDFALDIRKNDSFKIVYEEMYLDGEKIGHGNIVAAEFINQGEQFRAVQYINEKGDSNFYTPDGKNMRKAFLRAPLDFRRISSNFNPKRLHPIFKTVKPHRGTDYVAPLGTPIWSSGDGKVIRSGYTKANGNYVIIQHGGNIQTKYLHLHKRYVKTGQRVKQKQKIGSLGSTGYSTGPHLHYEFLVNGVHRNPRTIVSKLPKAKSIDSAELERFKLQTAPLLAELGLFKTQYASADE